MTAVTLANLRSRARTYAEERPGGTTVFLTDPELTVIINDCIKELYDILVAARGHEFYISSANLALVAGTETYNLPADFYELEDVQLVWSATEVEPVQAFERNESDWYRNFTTWGRWTPKAFRLSGGSIQFLPTPKSAVTATLIYIPTFTDLSGDSQTFDGVNGWELLVTLEAAIAIRAMQKLETGPLEMRRDRQLARIQALASERAANHPQRVRDVCPEGVPYNRRWPERLPPA